MKSLIIIGALASFCINPANAQKIKANEVPQAVKDSFSKEYPSNPTVQWEKEDGLYEANFKINKKEVSVSLDNSGVIKEVETELAKTELPSAVQAELKKSYGDYKIEEIAKIVSNETTTYEAEVEKGESSFELIFDSNGKLLKKTEEKEHGDKD